MLKPAVQLVTGLPWWVLLPIGVAMLLKGADWLVDGAVAIALRMRFSILFIGLTVVAFGTSAPELSVNVIAAWNGNPDLSFGNIIGSNIANIGLVIGLGALVAPIHVDSRVMYRELPLLLVVSVGIIGLAYLPLTRVPDASGVLVRGFNRIDGLVMLAAFLVFCISWYHGASQDESDPLAQEASERAREQPEEGPLKAWILFLGGLVVLVAGGKLTEMGAVSGALRLGISNTVIGLTVVAIATSLPEVFTVIIATRKNQADLAVGNVVGSNVFNLLLVLAATSIIAGVPLPPVGWQDLAVMVMLTVLLLVVAHTRQRAVRRAEGLLLLWIYAAYLVWAVVR